MTPDDPSEPGWLAGHVVQWQQSHGRHALPWQNTRDPYRVWLSEIMLQQTQVTAVLGYYSRFLQAFPDVQALAQATEDEVFALWAGLGYYSRARNLHACARQVVEQHGGSFPRTAQALQTLPGIGRSTAAAIAAFCFSERVAILDGNVKRVLTRVLAYGEDLAVAGHERTLWALASDLLPQSDLERAMPRYTQGLMDLGATVCTARNPSCLVCPLQSRCAALRQGRPQDYPVKTRKLKRSSARWWLLWAEDADGRVFIARRPSQGIWAGLHCLPVFESEDALLASLPPVRRDGAQVLPAVSHVLTHKDLLLQPVWVVLAPHEAPGPGRWLTGAELATIGLPTPVKKLLSPIEGPASAP